MIEEALDSLQGHMSAMNALLINLCATLTPVQAARLAVHLELERQEQNSLDHDQGISDQQAQTRDTVLRHYLQLLSSLSRG